MAEGDEEEPFVSPYIDSFGPTDQYGDFYVFGGHAGGTAAAGGIVTFTGVLAGTTASIDQDGNFSVTLFLPDGQTGFVDPIPTDAQGNTGSPYPFELSIEGPSEGEEPPNEDPEEEEEEEEEGDPEEDPSEEDPEEENGEGSGEEGDEDPEGEGEGEDPEYVWPSLDYVDQIDLGGGNYMFTGHASGSAVGGASVQFYGLLEGIGASVDGDGNFYAIAYFAEPPIGFAEAQLTDNYGNLSGSASFFVSFDNSPPEDEGGDPEGDGEGGGGEGGSYTPPQVDWINYTDEGAGTATITGYVSGTGGAGASLVLSGVLEGYYATTDQDGYFTFTAYFPSGAYGAGYAQAIDSIGTGSSVVSLSLEVAPPGE
ncbi:MAG: hypothetical protein QM775_22270 [Pirellulales bacterium]